MPDLCDLHSHVIAGIDDGARDLDESLELLEGLRELGYRTVVATPHARPGLWDPPDDEVRGRHAALVRSTLGRGIEVEVLLGAEHYWDARVFQVERERLRPHQDASALLVEVPTHETPRGLEEACFRLRVKGLLPLLAHPERYGDLIDNKDRLTELSRYAAYVVDLGSLVGSDGWRVERAARWLLKSGLARAVASDVHHAEDLEMAGKGLEWIRKKLGDEAVQRLAGDNPRRLLAGEWPD